MHKHRLVALAALSIALPPSVAAQISLNKPRGPLFVDFSGDLERPGVTVVIGTLGKMKDGKRRKLDDADAHIGSGNTVSRTSGTQYFTVSVKSRVDVDTWLAGKKPGKSIPVTFDAQLARLPDGSYKRQIMHGSRAELEQGMVALWVLEKGKRGHAILHAVAKPETDRDRHELSARAFERDMRDHLAINQRIAALKEALAGAKAKHEKGDEKGAEKQLDDVLETELELLVETNDRLVATHVAPWERRAKKLLHELTDGS
jgi:hypothetical protein